MKQEGSLKKNFVFITVGNVVYTLSQYLLLILFTKNFIKEDVGGYLYAMAFVTPLVQPLEMQLRGLYVTDSGNRLNLADYHSLRIICNLISLLLVIFGGLLFKPEMFKIIFVIGIIKLIESQMDICYATFQKKSYMYYISYSKMIRGISTLIIVCLLILSSIDFVAILYSWLVIWGLVFVFIDLKWTRKIDSNFFNLKKYFNLSNLLYLLKISWPLLLLDFVDKYYINYPNLFIEQNYGIKTVAIFGSILYFRAVGSQLIAPISNVTAPRLAVYWLEKKFVEFKSLLIKMIVMSILIGICGVLSSLFLGEWILGLLFTEEYARYNDILVYVMIISSVSYSYLFLGTSLTCMRKHWIKLPIHVFGFILLLGISNIYHFKMQDFMRILLVLELVIGLIYFVAVIYFFNKTKFKNNLEYEL